MQNSSSFRLPRISFSQTFAALQYPNYRLWFMGQLASMIGTWMQSTAQGFLIYQLTQSPAYLGYVGFIGGLPTWIFMLFGGVASDRMSRRKLMIITQTAMMLLAFILAGLTYTKVVQAWQILVLAFLLGIANAFDAPARQSFVLEMVEREDLGNAIALNAAMFNMAAAIGPAVAGLTYAALGPVWCFTINGVSFLAVIAALAAMKLKPFQPPARRASAIEDLKEGLRFTTRHEIIRTLIILVGVTALFATGYGNLFPAWAVEILHGNSATNGYLQSARGIGALLGALTIASLGRFHWKGKLLTIGTFLFPVFVIVYSLMRWLPASLLLLVGVGWASMMIFNLGNALVQGLAPDELRGRVMGVYTLIFFGMFPIGSLLAGSLAEWTSLTAAVLITASISLVTAVLLYIIAPKIRKLE